MKAVLVLLGLWAGAVSAQDATYRFEWQGAGGYAMTGAMSFDAALIGQRLVREADVSCFVITGTRDGRRIGDWRLGWLGPDTSWRLFFDTMRSEFVVEGRGVRMPQAWNMNGAGDDCGEGGFGFNLGNLGQDVCLSNRVVPLSRIAPEVPFPAARDDGYVFPRGACVVPDLLG